MTTNRTNLMEELGPLTKLIAQELLAQLKEDGLVLAHGATQAAAAGPRAAEEGNVLTLKETSDLLGHSYFWLSRNYKRLSLRPVRLSGKLLFTRKEVEELLQRNQTRFRGRPPKPTSTWQG